MHASFVVRARRSTLAALALVLGLAVGAYAAYACRTWWTYGRTREAGEAWRDELLDRFLPRYDVVERHHIKVDAPASVTLAAAAEQDFTASPIVRALFKTRSFVMGAKGTEGGLPKGLVAQVKALGWGVLAETENEIVMGAVTEPWKAVERFANALRLFDHVCLNQSYRRIGPAPGRPPSVAGRSSGVAACEQAPNVKRQASPAQILNSFMARC